MAQSPVRSVPTAPAAGRTKLSSSGMAPHRHRGMASQPASGVKQPTPAKPSDPTPRLPRICYLSCPGRRAGSPTTQLTSSTRAGDGALSAASTEEIITHGESKQVEFRQTGRINLHTKQRDPVTEQMVVKSLAGFMNTAGERSSPALPILVRSSASRQTSTRSAKTEPRRLRSLAHWLTGQHARSHRCCWHQFQFDDFPTARSVEWT